MLDPTPCPTCDGTGRLGPRTSGIPCPDCASRVADPPEQPVEHEVRYDVRTEYLPGGEITVCDAYCDCGWTASGDEADTRDAGWRHELAFEWAHQVQADVADFHRVVCEIEDQRTPGIRRPELRASLIEEEARETVEAIRRGDLVEVIDGMCDLLCVVYGTACEFGIDLAPFWDEVHRTNMAKAGGPVREDGKRLKPPGWQPPDIAGVLRAEQARERDRG